MKLSRLLGLACSVAAFLLLPNRLPAAVETAMPDARDPLAGMGVNIHFTDARPGELEMLSRAGFRWVRMDFQWAATEPVPGRYNFSAYDRLLADLDHFHIRALLILDYVNRFYDEGRPTHSPEGRAAFARWAAAAASHFKNRGVLWEIWNEPNGDWFWKPKANANDYAQLALAVNAAIHAVAPRELVVGPALSGTNLDFLAVSARAGAFKDWAAITIHPYLRHGPERYGPAYDQIRAMTRQYGGGRKIDVVCGESGYSSIWDHVDETTHGEYLARMFLFNVMSGVPITIWYDWHDDGTDPKDQECHFGIVHNEYHAGAPEVYDPKPAYTAACTYSLQLTGYRFQKRLLAASSNDFILLFKGRHGDCLAAWTTSPEAHQVEIPSSNGMYDVVKFDGQPGAPVTASQGRLTLQVDGGPQYLKKSH